MLDHTITAFFCRTSAVEYLLGLRTPNHNEPQVDRVTDAFSPFDAVSRDCLRLIAS